MKLLMTSIVILTHSFHLSRTKLQWYVDSLALGVHNFYIGSLEKMKIVSSRTWTRNCVWHKISFKNGD